MTGMDVDVVYRWINPANGSEKLRKNLLSLPNALRGQMNCAHRYRDNDELKYSLRSVARYASWVRTIHIVGEGAPPAWMDTSIPSLNWIGLDHLMEADDQTLPMNSETQKLYFTKIPGLAENFICMDDDWFFGNEVVAEDFFAPDGKPILPSNDLSHGGHAPTAWTRTLYDAALNALPQEFVDVIRRGGTDRLDPMPEMRRYLEESGHIVVSAERDARVWLRDVNNQIYPRVLKSVIESRPKYFCINDDWSTDEKEYSEEMEVLHQFFESMYPNAAPWEKSAPRFRARPDVVRPICISAHAFGRNRPNRDLLVSSTQDICVDVLGEVLIPAIMLLNGSTIRRVDVDDIVGGDNVPPQEGRAETNDARLFEDTRVVHLDPITDTTATQPERFGINPPLHEDGPLVEFVRSQLRKQAQSIGWSLTQSPDVYLEVDGRQLEPIMQGMIARFHVPAAARDVWLVSPTARPCETMGGLDDRDLGLYLSALRIDDGFSMPREITIDNPLLCVGFHDTESGTSRWTAGRARLPASLWDGCEHGFFLRVELGGLPVPRWVEPAEVVSPHLATARA